MFLSKGLQLAVAVLIVIVLFAFMQIGKNQDRIAKLERCLSEQYVEYDEYLETFDAMFEEKMKHRDVLLSPAID